MVGTGNPNEVWTKRGSVCVACAGHRARRCYSDTLPETGLRKTVVRDERMAGWALGKPHHTKGIWLQFDTTQIRSLVETGAPFGPDGNAANKQKPRRAAEAEGGVSCV